MVQKSTISQMVEFMSSNNSMKTSTDSLVGHRAWLFQANPTKYRIYDSLRTESIELWNLRQHAGSVHAGHRVVIWLSGADAGIYAVGTVMANPTITSDSEVGQRYWEDARDGRRAIARVPVRYDEVLLKRPLSKVYLQAIPDLWSMKILRSPRGTNFPVTDKEWKVIHDLLFNP